LQAQSVPIEPMGNTMKNKMLSAIMLVLLLAVLVGCNTLHGLGKDIEEGGEAIQRATK